MAMPFEKKPYNVWVHHDAGGRIHHLWQGDGSTPPHEVRASLLALAEKHGRKVGDLHFRVGQHNDVNVFASEEQFDAIKAADVEAKKNATNNAKSYFRKMRQAAPDELVRAILDYAGL